MKLTPLKDMSTDVRKVTPKLRKVLMAIDGFLFENRYAPNIDELCQICDVSSSATIHFHLNRLRKMGLVDWIPNQHRTIHTTRE